MKKRLLSAALALAMVLTMIPFSAVPASAATPSPSVATAPTVTSGKAFTEQLAVGRNGMRVTWYAAGAVLGKDMDGNEVKTTTAGYYAWDSGKYTAYWAADGYIAGTNSAGGNWYPVQNSTGTSPFLTMNSFTLVNDVTMSANYNFPSSISINLNGFSTTLVGSESGGYLLNSLTVTNSPADPAIAAMSRPTGTLTLPTQWTAGTLTDRSITLNATNATISGSIAVQGTTANNYGLSVTLKNSTMGAGTLSVTGTDANSSKLTLNMQGSSTVGNVTATNATLDLDMSADDHAGEVKCTGKKADIDAKGTYGHSAVIAKIDLGEASPGAKDNKSGGTIDLTSAATVTNNITVYGQTTINVRDTSVVNGNISFLGGADGDGPSSTKGAPNWQGVTINVSGYQTNIGGGIEQKAGDTLSATIKVEDTARTGMLNLGYGGTVTVSNASTDGITLPRGTLTISNGAAVRGALTLSGAGQTTATISGADTTVTGDVTAANKNVSLTINDGHFDSNSQNVSNLESGATTVRGGTFGVPLRRSPVLSNIAYEFGADKNLDGTPETYTYVPSGTVNDVFKTLVDLTQAAGGVGYTQIRPANLPVASGNQTYVYFLLDHNTTGGSNNTPVSILRLFAEKDSIIDLPTQAGGRNVTYWYKGEDRHQTNYIVTQADIDKYAAGPKGDADEIREASVQLVADSTMVNSSDITAVNLRSTVEAVNKGLTVGLDSTNKIIKLSGLVTLTGNQASIPLNLVNARGTTVMTVSVLVDRSNNQTRLYFTDASNGLTIRGDNKILAVNNSTQEFTLDGSGLTIRDTNLPVSVAGSTDANPNHIIPGPTKATVSGGIGGTAGRDSYKARLETSQFNTTANSGKQLQDSEAVQQALNNVLKGITKSQVDSWLATARRAIATELKDTNSSKYADTYAEWGSVQIEPYLDIQVTNWTNKTGTQSSASLNVNLTLKYRVVAVNSTKTSKPWADLKIKYPQWNSSGTDDYKKMQQLERYEVTTGTLNLTGNYGDIELTLALPDNFAPTGTQLYAHHGNYAYQANTVAGSGDVRTVTFTTSHGFSPFTLNEETPVAKVDTIIKNGVTAGTADNFAYLYDNLNTAVAEVADKGTIKLYPGFATGTTNVPVSGKARMFWVVTDANSQTKLNFTGSNTKFTGDEANGNMTYTVTLSSDTAVPTEKPVAITVATAANGAATSSAARADYGETVTITVRPNAGYGLSTLTIRTNTGANVAYQSTTTNVFTFKVPENVTSITVTPAFAVSSTAAISVTDTVNGLATTNAANNRAAGGSTVTVTTRPFNGYRTSAVTAVSNTGAAVAVTRVAENTYTFVVPVAATSVVITPTFTASGHPFTDVPDGQWYSDAVSFGYRHGMFTGYNGSTTRFAGMERLTRAELVVILYRLSGEPATTDNSGFSDVGSGIWYSKAITWATRNNIVRGGDNNRFYPLNNVTREELAQMLYNYNSYRRGSAGLTGNLSRFTDSNRVHSYHLTAMQWAVGNGIVQGNNNSQLNPGGTASRYEVAVMLMRYGQSFMGLT